MQQVDRRGDDESDCGQIDADDDGDRAQVHGPIAEHSQQGLDLALACRARLGPRFVREREQMGDRASSSNDSNCLTKELDLTFEDATLKEQQRDPNLRA